MKKILVLVCCTTFSLAFGADLRKDTDIAVDQVTGLSYFVQKYDNPQGLVMVYGIQGQKVGEFSVSGSRNANWTEIELVRSNRMLVLQQHANSWSIQKFERVGEVWEHNSSSELVGDGIAYKLNSVDANHVIVEHLPVGAVKSEKMLIEDTRELRVVQTIPTEKFEESLQAATQKVKLEESKRGGLGFTAGLISGLGFAYRKHFENSFGIQVGGIGWGDQNSSFTSVGAEIIKTISRSEKVRFYALGGTSIFRRNQKDYQDYSTCYAAPGDPRSPTPPPDVCIPVTGDRTTGTLNFGAGLGFEFTPSKHIGISLELPVTLMLDLEKTKRFKRQGIYPIPSISLVYYF